LKRKLLSSPQVLPLVDPPWMRPVESHVEVAATGTSKDGIERPLQGLNQFSDVRPGTTTGELNEVEAGTWQPRRARHVYPNNCWDLTSLNQLAPASHYIILRT